MCCNIVHRISCASINQSIFSGNPLLKDNQLADLGIELQKENKLEDAIFCFTKAIVSSKTLERKEGVIIMIVTVTSYGL